MKKIKVVLCCIILCMNLGGCGKPMSRGKQLARELGSEQQLADRMMEEIVAALDNGDVEALKSLFSKDALKEVEYMDEQIQDVLDFYQGKKQSFEGDASSSTHTKYGEDIEKELKGHYTLITDAEQYMVAYQYEVVDKHNPDREGLLSMEIVTDATYQKRDFRWQYADNPGVFLQR